MGYIHGDRLASSHHVLPQSGWISYWINKGEEQLNQDHNHRSNKAEHQMTLLQTRNLLSCL